MKKLLGIMLSVCMVVTMLPTTQITAKADTIDEPVSVEANVTMEQTDVVEEQNVETTQSVEEQDTQAVEQEEAVTDAEDLQDEDATDLADEETDTKNEDASVSPEDENVQDDAVVEDTAEGADEEIVAEQDGETTPQTGSVASVKRPWDSNTYYYNTVAAAITVAQGNKDTVVKLLKDVRENIYITAPVTLDLGGHQFLSQVVAGSVDYGPIYLQHQTGEVIIQNGTVGPELDGNGGFSQIQYRGTVILNNVKVIGVHDTNPNRDIPGSIWTDGHDYIINSGNYTGCTIQNINSQVYIHGGEFSKTALSMYYGATEPEKYDINNDKQFIIDGGTYPKDTDLKDYVVTNHTKTPDTLDPTNKIDVVPLSGARNQVAQAPAQVAKTGHSVTIATTPNVQYAVDKANGPWYLIGSDGKLVKIDNLGKVTPLPDGKDDAEGVVLHGDKITFTKDVDGKTIPKSTEVPVYAKYTDAAVAADGNKSNKIVSTVAKSADADAVDIAKAFNQANEAGSNPAKKTTGALDGEKATNPHVEVVVADDVNGYVVKVIDADGTITEPNTIKIPDNFGNVTLDLNGKKIVGPNGTQASPEGKDAIEMTKGTGSGTNLKVVDNSPNKGGEIKGGDAFAGSGKNGGDGIQKDAGTKSQISVGQGAKVIGGNGANSSTSNGGNGGNGVNGDIVSNEGTIAGGQGGNATAGTGNGGNGGNGVNGNVSDKNGTNGAIIGGNGGSSVGGNGGNGGNGVNGNVSKNDGGIGGGAGGNVSGGSGNAGSGGAGVTGNVTANAGKVSGGNGGNNSGKGAGGNAGDAVSGNIGSGKGKTQDGKHGSGHDLYNSSEPLKAVDKQVTTTNTDKTNVKGSNFSTLRLKAIGGNKKIKLVWKKQSDADGYIIYGSMCGKNNKLKKIKEIKNGKTTTWTHTKLNKGKYYKYVILAYKKFGKEKRVFVKSISAHATTFGGKYVDPTGVKLKTKNKISMKKGKTGTIKASYTKKKGKVQEHIKIIRFQSSNAKIASVSASGKVKARKKGKCTIFVFSQNGFYKTVKVTVK